MLGLLAPAAFALVAAWWRGGSPRRLLEVRFRGWPLVALGFGLELALYNPPLDQQQWAMFIGPWVWLAVRLVFVAVLVVNSVGSAAWAWRVAALGVALNTLVIAANDGHMPRSPEAALAVWGASEIDPHRLQNVSLMGPQTRLGWLGDVIPEPAWLPRRNVVSIGDILLALGVAAWVYAAIVPTRTVGVIASGAARRIGAAAGGEHQGRPNRGSSPPQTPGFSKHTTVRS